MNTLILDTSLTGHRLEYINYLYNGAKKRCEEHFIFAVPRNEWEKVREKRSWPDASNIQWLLLDDRECQEASNGSMLARCLRTSKLIRRVAIEQRANKVKLISIAGIIPILPLILPSYIKLSGIIYEIYLRANKSKIKRIIDYFRYSVMARNVSMGKVFILNDPRSADKLNKIYHTNRFIPLVDPVPDLAAIKYCDMRKDLAIPEDAKVFLHFGAMDKRKGTIEILRAINLITEPDLKNNYFIFAGQVGDNIRLEFYTLVDDLKSKGVNIIIRDEFCSYELLHSLCKTSDVILIPYLLTDLSSGALGYAALHNKPVIGPGSGLIGELINDNKLGITLQTINPETLAKAFAANLTFQGSEYAEKNAISSFTKTFLDS